MAAATRTPTSTSTPHPEPFPPLEPAPQSLPLHTVGAASKTTAAADDPSPQINNTTFPTSPVVRDRLETATPKSAKARLSPSPLPLTGAAAMAELKRRKQQQQNQQNRQQSQQPDSRQTSPNPAVEAMQSLMSGTAMSKASDAPAPDKLSEPMRLVADKIHLPDGASADSEQPSPISVASSFVTNDSTAPGSALTATASIPSATSHQFVAEPAPMNDAYPGAGGGAGGSDTGASEGDASHAYTYPGPPPSDQQHQQQDGGPARGMSLPGYGQSSPRSPASNKRHKCPYCSTDFTRHHNLKSHLLTHSQEKPYVCQTCNARFRRLHDLKRHTKLHTGERPHTCDKCGRRFARGDALARHNKGPGGCAGRRSSFGGDDDFGPDGAGPDGMDGVEYTGEEDEMLDAHGRRVSEPSRKRAHLESAQDPNRQVYRQHSSTYPPPRPGPGSMAPPQVIHPGSNNASAAAASPRDGSGHPSPNSGVYYGAQQGGQAQMYSQSGGMTESPKPLSPGGHQQPANESHRLGVPDGPSNSVGRNRSPSLTTQFQQAHFGRGSGRGTPPYSGHVSNQSAPQLPILPGLGSTSQPQQTRPAMQPTAGPSGPGPSMLQHGQLPPSAVGHGSGSGANSLSSHGQSSGNSIRDALGHEQNDIWNYVRSLEQRFHRMQDEYELRISRLQEEVISLRGQVSNSASYSSEMAGQQRY